MARFAIVSIGLIGAAVAAGGTGLTPERLGVAGLGAPTTRAEETRIRDAHDRRLTLEEEGERIRQRTTMTGNIAAHLCDGRLTLFEAIDATEPFVRASPDWFRSVRLAYLSYGVPPTATDREVIAAYLFQKIGHLAENAAGSGDPGRAAAITARRAELEAEWARATPPPVGTGPPQFSQRGETASTATVILRERAVRPLTSRSNRAVQ